MKTQKRDPAYRAYKKGYQNGIDGRSSDYCPYSSSPLRQNWLNGWNDGRQDQVTGFPEHLELMH